jgi:ribonuclease BN (tRNA processing enzyme)
MTNLRLEILGFRGAAPLGGACPAYLVTTETTKILLDCGPGATERLHARGLLGELDAIVISHPHMDHVLDLVPLSGEVIDTVSGHPRTPLHVPQGSEPTLTALGAAFGEPDRIATSFALRPYAPADVLRIGDLTLSFAPTAHAQPCNAMRVTDGERTLLYGADGAPSDALTQLAQGADLLLLEASGDHPNHSTAAQSRALADAVGARVVLTHLIDPLTGDDVAYEGLVVDV